MSLEGKTLYTIQVEPFLKEFGEDTVCRYDALKAVVAVQGLRNRQGPELFLFWADHDTFWLRYMMEPDHFMHGMEIRSIDSFDEFLKLYGPFIKKQGLALWDYAVPATMNVATTACGIDGFIPVRSGSNIADRIMKATGAACRLDLVGKFTGKGTIPDTDRPSSGSAKCDAYLWALAKYFDQTNDRLLVYNVDAYSWDAEKPYYPDLGNAFVPNHDYAIMKKAFVFDVSCWGDEVPCDDPNQPLGTDLATMKEILQRQYDRTEGKTMTQVCGFNPWQLKYTSHKNHGKHEGVESEWMFTEIISCYNCVKDADAYGYCGLANASVYTQYPLDEKYKNHRPKEEMKFDPKNTYVLFYVGDYDAGAWTARHIPKWYNDPALGKNPLMWCFNTNLSERIPMAFDFVYKRFTDNDYFQAGDSGAGYNNPALLYEPRKHSGLPSGVEANVAHNKYYFDKFDQQIIGFVIDGWNLTTRENMADLARFAPMGAGGNHFPRETQVVNGGVFIQHSSDLGAENLNLERALELAFYAIDHYPPEKRFHIFRTILVSPTNHDKLMKAMKERRPEANFVFCDPYNFFRMAKEAKEKGLTY